MKVIDGLLTTLHSPNDALDHFWKKSYSNLQKNTIDRKSNVNTLEVLLQNKTLEDLKGKKRADTPADNPPAKRRQADGPANGAFDIESDGITIPNTFC